MNESIHEAVVAELAEKCPPLRDAFEAMEQGSLEKDDRFIIYATLTNADHPATAQALVELYSPKDQKMLDQIVEGKSEYGNILCETLGCNQDQISNCFPSSDGSGCPAIHLRTPQFLTKIKIEEAKLITDSILYRAQSGDKGAHLESESVSSFAVLKAFAPADFERLVQELKDAKIKVADFKKLVSKQADLLGRESVPAREMGLTNNFYDDLSPLLSSGTLPYGADAENDLVHTSLSKDGPLTTKISNFLVVIRTRYNVLDGQNKEIEFEIEGKMADGTKLPLVTVSAKDAFSSGLRWIPRLYGNQPTTYVGNGTSDLLRECLQLISQDAKVVNIHARTGWFKTKKGWIYLYSGGYIGSSKILTREIEGLENFKIDSHGIEAREAIENGLMKLFNVASRNVVIPLIAYSFLAIIRKKLTQAGARPKTFPWVYGSSGSFKTSVTLLFQNFFGSFDAPPLTFQDTINSVEKILSVLQDGLALCDDFHPAATPAQQKHSTNVAQRIARMVGDNIGKNRAKSNMNLQKRLKPNANVICTSEDLMTGLSTNARIFCLELKRRDVNTKVLTELQRDHHYLNSTMYYFIKYAAENIMPKSKKGFYKKFLKYRADFTISGQHGRLAESMAILMISYDEILKSLLHYECISEGESTAMAKEAKDIFVELSRKQSELIESEDICDVFMSSIRELIASGDVSIQSISAPAHLAASRAENVIGWQDDDYYYLLPTLSYIRVRDFMYRKGESFGISERMLWKTMADKDLIRTDTNSGHIHPQKRVGLSKKRLAHLSKAVVDK